MTEDKVVFKSRVHILVFDDYYGVSGQFFDQHIKSTGEDFEKLILCDNKANPDRLGRNNVSFFPMCRLREVS